jgi:hypothetical protein
VTNRVVCLEGVEPPRGVAAAGDPREHVVAVSARIMNERQGVPRLRANVRLVSRGAQDSSSEVSDFDRGS